MNVRAECNDISRDGRNTAKNGEATAIEHQATGYQTPSACQLQHSVLCTEY
jgi:hypothetical protein